MGIADLMKVLECILLEENTKLEKPTNSPPGEHVPTETWRYKVNLTRKIYHIFGIQGNALTKTKNIIREEAT